MLRRGDKNNQHKSFSNQSINYQLIFFELCLIILVIIVSLFVFLRTSGQIIDQNRKYVHDIMHQMENNINSSLSSIKNIGFNVSIHEDVKEIVIAEDVMENYSSYVSAIDYIKRLKLLNSDINEIALIGSDGSPYNLGFEKEKNKKIMKLVDRMKENAQVQYLGMVYSSSLNSDEVVFGRVIYDEVTLQATGYVIILVDEAIFLRELIKELGEFYLVDANDEVVFSMDKAQKGITLEGQRMMSDENWIVDLPLRITSMNTNKQLTKEIKETAVMYIILIGIMLFIILFTYLFFSKYTVKPLYEISTFISNISGGDLRLLKKRMDVNGPREIRVIKNEINDLLNEVHNLSHRLVSTTSHLYNIELEKKKAELNFLKSQINPHFLYNTLGIIKSIATIRGDQETKAITSALVKIFRYSVKGEDLVEFKQELDICKAYIDIQKFRFNERFEVNYSIDPTLYHISMQKMILQPLIENAIFHGIESISRKSTITVGGVLEEKDILVFIQDDGRGIEESKLTLIQEKLYNSSDPLGATEHVGMFNVNSRLIHYWGEEAGLKIESKINQGTKVYFRIPRDRVQ